MKELLIAYLVVINLVAIVLMYIDKQKAKKHQWRISEDTLIGVAILGGGIGALWGMHVFRHKTKHAKFTIGIPLILAAQALLVLYIIR
ncbi:DUF1294 domain-containing protein [Clostridium sp. LIBA-8841]|uniref:DUF1294 domain-containing protein n=1 Tax=Clostridium sp. LIBA-8841 TaxID=2987530 RepID=UPI002AC7C343|nr:DUF1294 domain-containing protein [Clostridium sp. LIBA-8841]MDZ5254307.1 DUF1294 domain-containing protein [Clostridium sp. LIBA-8841]